MNKTLVSGYIKGKATLVENEEFDKFLIGTLVSSINIGGYKEEVEVALLYDKKIAKIPYWSLKDGDHVYLSGFMTNIKLPYKGSAICNSWFKIDSIEMLPSVNHAPKKNTKIEKSLRIGSSAFRRKDS